MSVQPWVYGLVLLVMDRTCARCLKREKAGELMAMVLTGTSESVRLPFCLTCCKARMLEDARDP